MCVRNLELKGSIFKHQSLGESSLVAYLNQPLFTECFLPESGSCWKENRKNHKDLCLRSEQTLRSQVVYHSRLGTAQARVRVYLALSSRTCWAIQYRVIDEALASIVREPPMLRAQPEMPSKDAPEKGSNPWGVIGQPRLPRISDLVLAEGKGSKACSLGLGNDGQTGNRPIWAWQSLCWRDRDYKTNK